MSDAEHQAERMDADADPESPEYWARIEEILDELAGIGSDGLDEAIARVTHALPWRPTTVDRLVPSPDARWLAVVFDRGRLAIFDLAKGAVAVETRIERNLAGAVWWDHQGRLVVPMSLANRSADFASERRIDPVTGRESGPPRPVGRNLRASIDTPWGWVSAMATDDEFTLFPADGGEPIPRDQAHAGGVNAFAIADGGRTLVTGGTDGRVRLWSMPEVEPLLLLPGRLGSAVRCLAVVDDRQLLVGCADGTVVRFDAVPRQDGPESVDPMSSGR